MENGKIILIDSNNIAYRAFYALPPTITTSTGIQTNAVYGFTAMLLKLIEEQKPENIACAFDSAGPTFRHEAYEEYKATRKKMPEELAGQIKLIKEVAEALNIAVLEKEGYEADDLIATLAGKIKNNFSTVLIVSSDKDILQLVGGNVSVIALKKGITDTVLYDSSNVREKFGVDPQNIKDMLALTGDSSDNIPGVPGIGPKTALELLQQFEDIENLYKNIDNVKNEKLRNLLVLQKPSAIKSLELTCLADNLEMDTGSILDKNLSKLDYKKAADIFELLEFKTLKNRLDAIWAIYSPGGAKKGSETGRLQIETTDQSQLQMSGEPRQMAADGLGHYIDDSRKTARKIMLYYNMPVEKGMSKLFKERAYIDFFIPGCETGEVKPRVSNAARIFKEKQSGFLIIHDGAENFYIYDETIAEMPEKFAAIKKILGDPSVRKSGFDFKQIFRFLKNSGLVLNGAAGDFKIQYLLLNPFMADVSIEQICSDLIENYIQGSIPEKCEVGFHEASFGAAGTQGNLGDFLSGRSIRDCLDEIKRFLLSYSVYYPVLEDLLSSRLNIENMDRLYHDIEAPLIEVLAEMENRGVNINLEYLNDLISEYEINIKALTGDIYRLCNSSFNINSPQQLAKILYQDLKLSPVKKTKTGFSTDASALFALYDMHPVIEKILDFREKVKLKNTYLDVLPNIINPDDGRVHATYNQLGTTTGRLSSNNPNMQNIPVRTELGKQIRKAFIPGMGYDLLLSADYSQIELRILAHLADDRDLIEAFNSGEDIHSKTAAEIFGVTYDGVDEGLRRKAKAINFGIIYGMTEFGLKSRLSISEEEAREYIRLYFNRYPSVKSYINSLISGAYKTGFVTTMFGRRRYIKELSSMNANIRSLGERLAVNTPIQGTAADIMKLATVNIFRKIKETGIDSNIVLHVHDEIVLEVSNKDIKRVESIVKNCMENAVQLKTELKVDLKTGRNWLLE